MPGALPTDKVSRKWPVPLTRSLEHSSSSLIAYFTSLHFKVVLSYTSSELLFVFLMINKTFLKLIFMSISETKFIQIIFWNGGVYEDLKFYHKLRSYH